MSRPSRDIPWLELRNGVYNVGWYEKPAPGETKGRTKRLGLRTRDAGEAQARYAEFLSQGTDLVLRTSSNAGLTVSGALDAYDVEHVEPNVVDKDRQRNAIRILKSYFGTTPLKDVDIPRCRAYADARRAGTVSGSTGARQCGGDATIKRELAVLRAASKHALRWKRINLQQYPTFESPSEGGDGQESVWFTKAEIELLLSSATGPLRDWILLTYLWGARRKSTERLEATQVTLETGRVNLQKPGQRVTKKRRPIVPIYPEMKPTLERLVAGGGFLFGPEANFYPALRTLCSALGLDHKAWPHVLRHSRATHMLMDGESIYKVAKLLGDSVATIERVYGHHSVEYLAETK